MRSAPLLKSSDGVVSVIRTSFGLALGVLVVLAVPASAQRGRCPFCMQAQLQMQMQWQQQGWMRQQSWGGMSTYGGGRRMYTGSRMRFNYPRYANYSTRRMTGITVHRQTVTYLRPIVTRRISNYSRTVVHRFSGGPGRYPGRSLLWIQRYRGHSTHLQLHLRRITEQHVRVTHRTIQLRRQTTTRRHLQMSVQRRTSTTPRRVVRHGGRRVERGVQHRPTVQLRVRLNGTCGTCHQCTQNQPKMVTLPQRQPFQVGPRNPLPGQPWLPAGPRPGPMVRLPDQPLLPMIGPRPGAPAFVVRKAQPQPIPALQPPALPPLGIDRDRNPRRPMLDLLTGARGDPKIEPLARMDRDRPSPGTSIGDTPPRHGTAIDPSPPPLPKLEGSVVQLSPLLGQKQDGGWRPAGVIRTDLLPHLVARAPRLPPLPGLQPYGRGLLPNLDGDLADGELLDPFRRPTLVELILRPPPLPPLPETASP
jgi:hypothetical protein